MTMTPAHNSKPTRRLVDGGRLGELVVELAADVLSIRRYRSRRPIIEATYGEVVTAVLLHRPPRRRRINRGRL